MMNQNIAQGTSKNKMWSINMYQLTIDVLNRLADKLSIVDKNYDSSCNGVCLELMMEIFKEDDALSQYHYGG